MKFMCMCVSVRFFVYFYLTFWKILNPMTDCIISLAALIYRTLFFDLLNVLKYWVREKIDISVFSNIHLKFKYDIIQIMVRYRNILSTRIIILTVVQKLDWRCFHQSIRNVGKQKWNQLYSNEIVYVGSNNDFIIEYHSYYPYIPNMYFH